MQKMHQVDLTVQTYSYKEGLEFKLIAVESVEGVNEKTKVFFKIAAKNLEADLADLFLVSPDDLNNLCKFRI